MTQTTVAVIFTQEELEEICDILDLIKYYVERGEMDADWWQGSEPDDPTTLAALESGYDKIAEHVHGDE